MNKKQHKSVEKHSDSKLSALTKQFHAAAAEHDSLLVMAQKQGYEAYKSAIRCGRLLIEIKKTVGHGNFGTWLKINANGVSVSTWENYMKLAKFPTVGNLETPTTLKKAYLQIGIIPDTPSRKALPPARREPPVIDVQAIPESVPIITAPVTDRAGHISVQAEATPPQPAPAAPLKVHNTKEQVQRIASRLNSNSAPRGGLAAEARRQDAKEVAKSGGWKAQVLAALEELRASTAAAVAYSGMTWDRYHVKVCNVINGMVE